LEYSEILNKFTVKKRMNNNKAQCICPNHEDKQASLSVNYNQSSKKTLIYCQAGCDIHDVLERVDLNVYDLFDNELEKKTVKKEDANIEKIYKYVDADGKVLFEKVRTKDKQFFQRRIINGAIVWGLEDGEYTETFNGSNEWSKKDRSTTKRHFPLQKPILYNLPKVIEAVKNNYWIFICEGEKDCQTLNDMGFIATTGSNGAGKGKWLSNYSEYFKGATVIILPDNDGPGKAFGEEIKRGVKKYAYSTRTIVISDVEKGDISDWSKVEGNNRDKLIKIVKDLPFLQSHL